MKKFKELKAFELSYSLAMELFELSKTFPEEEKYSLCIQLRRSSRAIAACIAEAYSKRRYRRHFISKLTDADMECGETVVWIDFAFNCSYISEEQHTTLYIKCQDWTPDRIYDQPPGEISVTVSGRQYAVLGREYSVDSR